MAGSSQSRTATVKLHVLVMCPVAESTAVKTIVFVPVGKKEPEGGVEVT
jgi:hypothetical protein